MTWTYSEDVRKRAIQLVLDEGKGYKEAGKILAEEFDIKAPSKSAIYYWIRTERLKRKQRNAEEEQSQETQEEQEEASENQSGEVIDEVTEEKQNTNLPAAAESIPRTTPENVAKKIQGAMGTVQVQQPVEEKKEEKPGWKRWIWFAAIAGIAALAFSFVIYFMRKNKSRKQKPVKKVVKEAEPQPVTQPKPEPVRTGPVDVTELP